MRVSRLLQLFSCTSACKTDVNASPFTVSMVEGEFFDKLAEIAKDVRASKKPFGGIQLVICGDFMQLPPVSRNSRFAFEAEHWGECIKRTIQVGGLVPKMHCHHRFVHLNIVS